MINIIGQRGRRGARPALSFTRVALGVACLGTAIACVAYGSAAAAQRADSTKAPAHPSARPAVAEKALAPANAPLPDQRLRLEQAFGHHTILMVRLMRGQISHDAPFAESAAKALRENTADLTGAIAAAYGQPRAEAFQTAWEQRIDALSSYGEALAAKDPKALAGAKAALDTQRAVGLGAPAAALEASEASLLAQADDYAAGNFAAAYANERRAYAAMFGAANVMATTAMPGPVAVPEQLRSQLVQLLGEHVELSFDATRAVVAGRSGAEAQAAAVALDGNNKDLLAGMTAAVGPAPTATFGEIWGRHIDALLQFAVAVQHKDQNGQTAARATFGEFPQQLAVLLARISSQRSAAGNVVANLQQHDQQLLQQVTATAAHDDEGAQEIANAAYDRMFVIAGTVAQALERKAAMSMPRGAAATGLGGMAGR